MPKAAHWLVMLDRENTATTSETAPSLLPVTWIIPEFLVTFQVLRVPMEGAKSHHFMASSSPSKAFPTEASRAELH